MSSHRSDKRGRRRDFPVADLHADHPTRVAPAVSPTAVKGGKRRAVKHAPGRAPLFRARPSAPVLAGLATAAIAAIGATSVGTPPVPAATTDAARTISAPAGAGAGDAAGNAAGTEAGKRVGLVETGSAQDPGPAATHNDLLSGREQPVSRDSQREALADVVNEDLVEEAEAMSKQRDIALSQSAAQAEAQAEKIELDTWVLPMTGYRLTAGFGQSSYLWSTVHTGQDLAAPSGTPIRSVANGVVTEAGYDGSYGNKTVITLEDGTEIWYCHQTSITVSVGDSVTGDELIGTVGSTGNTTGPHLHLEVRPGGGDPIDPMGALLEHGVAL